MSIGPLILIVIPSRDFSRKNVLISLNSATLNNIDVMDSNIKNDYPQAPTSKKHYIFCGP